MIIIIIIIIIINIFEYLVLSTTLYPLTSIIPYKKRLSSFQYSVFFKSYFVISLKISRIRPLFLNFCGDLISRISAVPIFHRINFRGNSWIWPKIAKFAKFNPSKVTFPDIMAPLSNVYHISPQFSRNMSDH